MNVFSLLRALGVTIVVLGARGVSAQVGSLLNPAQDILLPASESATNPLEWLGANSPWFAGMSISLSHLQLARTFSYLTYLIFGRCNYIDPSQAPMSTTFPAMCLKDVPSNRLPTSPDMEAGTQTLVPISSG